MGLLVWLPLNGTLENKGVSNITPTLMGSGITYTAGKIGNAATFPNACNSCIHMPGLKLQILTWTCWFKCNGEGSGTSQRILSEGRDTGSVGTNIWLSKAGTTLYWSAHKVSGSVAVTLNTWYHVALTCDGTKVHLYLNGAEQGTGTAYTSDSDYAQSNDRFVLGKMAYLYTSTSNYFPFNGQLNDVRVYDHCLSAAEVHEISQGLVLHYKLDSFQGGYGNPNIIVTHSNAGVDGTGTSGWSAAGTGWSNSFVSATGAIGGYAIRCTYANTSQTSGGIHHPTGIDKTTLTTGDIYTLSARIRTSKACVVTFQNELMTTGHTINATTDWQVYTYTCAIDTSKTYQSNIMYVRAADAVQNMWIECDWIKLEKGTATTPWQPSGVIGTAISDSSGYGHNGTITGNVSLNSNTPRYSASSLFNGTERITTATPGADIRTLSCWCKTTKNKSTSQQMVADSFSNMTISFYQGTVIGVFGTTRGTGSKCTLGNSYKENDWNHIVVVKTDDAGARDIYCNGVKLTPTSNDYWSAAIGFFVGARNTSNGNPFYGQISDVRAYCTALSAADVKQLYEVGAKVNNLGGLHTFEFQENGLNKITKTGITQGQQINEINNLSQLKYDPNVYIEPDGSAWIRIFHHNNPANARFTSSDTFATSVYKDADRWFNVQVCDSVTTWEFMLKQKAESTTTTESKYRWIQTVNPMTASYGDVAAASITKITTGYSNFTHGGLYKKNGSTYLCTNNGTSSNWWGAVGAWTVSSGGNPSWASTVVKSGYIDLYLRIDNITTTLPQIAKSTKNNIWIAHTLIEK